MSGETTPPKDHLNTSGRRRKELQNLVSAPTSLTDDLLLLILDDDRVGFMPLGPDIMSLALAGSVLMELQLVGAIDTDIDKLYLVDSTPTSDHVLNGTLAKIGSDDEVRTVFYWLDRTMRIADQIRELSLSRLVSRGVLEISPSGLPVLARGESRSQQDLLSGDRTRNHVKSRILALLSSSDIPEPREIAAVCLAATCGVLESLLPRDDLDGARERADLLRQMDLIGSAMFRFAETIRHRPAFTAQCPAVPGLPLLGNAVKMAQNLRGFLTEQYLRQGPVFRVRALNHRYLVLGGPQANLFVMRRGHHLLSSKPLWRGFCDQVGVSQVLIGMDGSEHIRLRKELMPNLSRSAFVKCASKVMDQSRRTMLAWPLQEKMGGFLTFQRMICSQLGLITTGLSADEYADDIILYFGEILKAYVTKQKPVHLRLPRFRNSEKRVREFAEKIMASHEVPRRIRDHDFVDDLTALNRKYPMLLPEADLSFYGMVPFFAGIDTAASTCAFMLYILLTKPDLMEQVRTEADEMFSSGALTESSFRRLDVTRRVAMETLRMYPAVEVVQRHVVNSFEFGGYRILPGEDVLVGTTIPHYLPECFPDPEQFDIDRYAPDRMEHTRPGAYAPFGVGVHKCVGQGLAQIQIVATLALLVHSLDIRLDPPEYKLKIDPMLTSSPDKKFRFVVVGHR